jgi:hypothetical protein
MNCSQTLSEPKNEFHSRIDQVFSFFAGVEANGQSPWRILSNLALHNHRERTCSILEKYIAFNFFLNILTSHRNWDYCAHAIILNQAK